MADTKTASVKKDKPLPGPRPEPKPELNPDNDVPRLAMDGDPFSGTDPRDKKLSE